MNFLNIPTIFFLIASLTLFFFFITFFGRIKKKLIKFTKSMDITNFTINSHILRGTMLNFFLFKKSEMLKIKKKINK